ncbi:beta-ketoacyl synthase N-terminal-like domain-containing protein, partial [Kibdelosporangium lantanae]
MGASRSVSSDLDPDLSGGALAVVGLSCRLPRSPDPASFWRLLAAGGDAITA